MLELYETGGSLRGAMENLSLGYVGSNPTHDGGLDYDPPHTHAIRETEAKGNGMAGSWSTWVSGLGNVSR